MFALRGMSPGAPRNPQGSLRNAEIGDLQLANGNSGVPDRAFCTSFITTPLYGGFAHLALPRWVLVGNVRPPRNVPRNPTEPHGALRVAEIGELRLESGNLRIPRCAHSFFRRRRVSRI